MGSYGNLAPSVAETSEQLTIFFTESFNEARTLLEMQQNYGSSFTGEAYANLFDFLRFFALHI